MSEPSKTLALVVAAAVALGGAYFVESDVQTFDVQQQVGKILNEEIDVAAPRRLQITRFEKATAQPRQFEVAEVDGVWRIPSKENYPADATRQMAEAATCVIDRKILRVAGESAESHPQFGLVDPTGPGLNSKSQGVGVRVVMTDADDEKLVDMIIGGEVKDSPGQRYVRNSNQDVSYVVELDADKLSTDFAAWIEDDLLQLSAFDIRKVWINDYSADLGLVMTSQGPQARIDWRRRGELTLDYDDGAAKWSVADLKKYDSASKEMVPDQLADAEEVNQDKLNSLRSGLDDLLIVDVVRKPEGLSNDLKAGKDFLNNREAFQDLVDKGFSPVPLKPGGEPEILSSEGEVVATLRDGVEYVLRFGQLQLHTDGASKADDGDADAKTDPDAQKSADDANLRRYLFVMARFNEAIIPPAELESVPELPAEEGEGDAAEAKTQAGVAEEDNDDDDDDTDAQEKSGEKEKEKEDAELAALKAKREEILAENKRKEDDRRETVEQGRKRVETLNKRFGDWYYVISNDVYKQIHLQRSDVIKKQESADKPAERADAAAAAPAAEAEEATSDAAPAADEPPLPAAPETPAEEAAPADAAD